MKEIERYYYGNDGDAINRHSARIYQDNDKYYVLDRILDIEGKPFQLLELVPSNTEIGSYKAIRTIRKFESKSWKMAEKKLNSI